MVTKKIMFYMLILVVMRRLKSKIARFASFRAGPNNFYFGGVFSTQHEACLDLNDYTSGFPSLSRHHKIQSMFFRQDRIHQSGAPIPARHTHIASQDMASTVGAGPPGGPSADPWFSGILILSERLPAG